MTTKPTNGKAIWTTVASGMLVLVLASSGAMVLSHSVRIAVIENNIGYVARDIELIQQDLRILVNRMPEQPGG